LEAKKAFNSAEKLKPTINSTYNLACVCSLLQQDDEVKGWLELCKKDGTLPSLLHLEKDTDLEYVRSQQWFSNIIESGPNNDDDSKLKDVSSSTLVDLLEVRSRDVQQHYRQQIPPTTDYVSQPIPPTDYVSQPIPPTTDYVSQPDSKLVSEFILENSRTHVQNSDKRCEIPLNQPIKYTDNQELNDAITYDEDLNKLQASLIREGFSMSTVIGMVVEVGRSKKETLMNNLKNEENRTRLNHRLQLCGYKEKRVIPGDGNCQFSSVSDQLFDTIDKASFVRKAAVEWLKKNKDWKLDNGAVMSDFVHDQSWNDFCNELSRSGIWGNHLTLVAIAEHFGSRLRVISSVESDSYIIKIDPLVLKTQKVILLSHYAEYHYGSLSKA